MDLENRFDTRFVEAPRAARPPLALKPAAAISAFALFLVVAMWAAVWSFLHNEYTGHIEAQKRENENLARALEEQTARVIAAADQALLRVKQRIESRNRDVDLARIASETGLAPKILIHLSIHNRDGVIIATNVEAEHAKARAIDDGDREHFRVHVEKDTGEVFVGPTIVGRLSGRFAIPLSRRLNGPDGRFDGVVTASIDPTYFTDLYGQVQLGSQGVVSLAGLDGTVRARTGGGAGSLTAKSMTAGLTHLAEAVAQGSSGSYIATTATDGVLRIYSFRRLADYPLVISVGSALSEALAHYEANRRVYSGLAAVFTAVVLIAVISLILSFDRLLTATEALRRSEAQAQSANRMKSEFLASMSHELHTPLTSIRGFSELMEKRLEHPGFREQAGIIRRAAEHLTAVLNDILDMSKIEAGAMEIVSKQTDVRKLATDTMELFGSAAAAKGLELALQVDVDVPRTASLDALRVKQILNNLLSNAIKFTDTGLVELHITRHGEQMVSTVLDTGSGIPATLHGTIFERFRQGDAEVSRHHGGTGLGLALSRSFAHLMGGDLTVDSAPGRGSRFILTLPLGKVSENENAPPLALAA
jgi:signal transduction histidine kinase